MDTTLLNSGVTAVGSRGPNRRGADTFIWDQGCKNPLNSGNEALMTFHPGQTESIVKKNRKTAKKACFPSFPSYCGSASVMFPRARRPAEPARRPEQAVTQLPADAAAACWLSTVPNACDDTSVHIVSLSELGLTTKHDSEWQRGTRRRAAAPCPDWTETCQVHAVESDSCFHRHLC